MNDLQALTNGILTKAKSEAEALNQANQEEIVRISAEAEAEAKAKQSLIAENYQKKIEDLLRRSQIEVELESKKKLLAAKHQLIQKAFELALKELKQLPAEQRIRFLAKKLAAAGMKTGGEVKGSGNQAEWVSIIKAANDIISSSGSTAKLTLSKAQPEFDGGFSLAGSGYVVNGSYQAILEEQQSGLVPQVAEFLFEKEKEG